MSDPFVFLSYRSFEREFAARLAADLRNAGIRAWMDALEGGIRGGDDWNYRLQTALDDCAGMIVVISPDYITSNYCRLEHIRVSDRGVPIIPLLLQHLDRPRDWPLDITGKQYIDFRAWRIDREYQAQFERLKGAIKLMLSGVVGSPPDAEIKYLNDLIATLGSTMGVLEYVDFGAELSNPDQRPIPRELDEWGYSMLVGPDAGDPGKEPRQYSNVAEVVRDCSSFVLLGAPGGGKTTTLRRLARAAAFKRREDPRSHPIPVLLNLAQWNDGSTPNEFVRSHWPLRSNPTDALRRGDIALFLDGLNEMGNRGPSNSAQLREWIASDDRPKTIVITCRLGDYEGPLRLGSLPTVTVKELTLDQVGQFARNYLENRANAFLRELEMRGEDRFTHNRGLSELARNPFFLRSLIELFVCSASGELPRNIGVLFDRLTAALWKREKERNSLRLVSFPVVRSRLARLARAQREDGQSTFVPLTYAWDKLTEWYERPFKRWLATRLLHSARSAGLVRLEADGCSFSHEVLQDYFAAISLLDASGRAQLQDVNEWLENPRLPTAPLIALCGMLADAEQLVRRYLEHDPLLAGQCVASGAAVSGELKQETVRRLRTFVAASYLGRSEKSAVAEALGLIGDCDTETIILLANLLRDDGPFVAEAAAVALGRIGTPAAARELRRAFDDPTNKASEFTVADALASIGEAAVTDLIESLQKARVEWPRWPSVRALVNVGKGAIPALLEAVRKRPGAIRAGSTRALGALGAIDAVPDLLNAFVEEESKSGASRHEYASSFEPAFKDLGDNAIPAILLAYRDARVELRASAVKALGSVGTGAACSHLIKALQDSDEGVRRKVAWELAHNFRTAAVPPLVAFLNAHSHPGAAEAALALGYVLSVDTRPDAEVVAALASVLEAGDALTRMQAARALGYVTDPVVSPTLLGALNNDKDPAVRSFAAESLGRLNAQQAIPDLKRCLQLEGKANNSLRRSAAGSLEKVGSKEAVEAAATFWRGVLSSERGDTDAIQALGRLKDGDAVPLLLESLQDATPRARGYAVDALALIGDVQAVPAIVARLSETEGAHSEVRGSAIRALGCLKDPRAVEPLRQLLSDASMSGYEKVSMLAASALEEIGTESALTLAGEYWRGVLRDADTSWHRLAVKALARLRYTPAIPDLIAALGSVEVPSEDPVEVARAEFQPTIGDEAALALEAIGGDDAVAAVVGYWLSALASKRDRARGQAIRVLGRLKRREAVPALIGLLNDGGVFEGRYVADYAADILEQFDAPEARIPLMKYRDWRAGAWLQ